ncbi:ATP-dependent DNA helicase [Methanonatronarchaeum sp. AMET-Sl]|uniref:ATP-dependent DNA helicase n=1 Tax=Methanonatronarchaeum sp. AMET-Sl TaxID=3037654 RepID=UPI00244E1F85|nr:ATP-dependent DNA helicase [Methanonatronarchaeum sp. AMET-Sl]WGI17399.1 ATP-dependent DNA helicase [Methanonatronarchaeum sp. AMET-Sl]
MTDYLDFFPKEKPYSSQLDAMEKISRGVSRGRVILFEGACGTGKTLAALAPSLEYAKSRGKKVVIATNVHQQMKQFIDEASEIYETSDIKTVVFQGKTKLCIEDMGYGECQALKEETYELYRLRKERNELKYEVKGSSSGSRDKKIELLKEIDREISEKESNSCVPLLNTLKGDGDFESWVFSDVRGPGDVVDWCSVRERCPYEELKKGLEEAELIICNYRHIMDPVTLSRFSEWLGEEGDPFSEAILILDEAHNLSQVARDIYSRRIALKTIKKALSEVRDEKTRNLVDGDFGEVETLFKLLFNSIKKMEPNKIWEGYNEVKVQDPESPRSKDRITKSLKEDGGRVEKKLNKALMIGNELESIYEEEFKAKKRSRKKVCYIQVVAEFLLNYLQNASSSDYYPYLEFEKNGGEVGARLGLFNCAPEDMVGSLLNSTHSTIMMSATLRPFSHIRKSYGFTDTLDLAYPMNFPIENRQTLAVDTHALFSKNRKDEMVVTEVSKILRDIISDTPGNVLVFFPNWGEAKKYYDSVDTDVEKFLDMRGESSVEVRDRFFEIGEGGGKSALFSYIWGTLSEGLDYSDNRVRTVVIVGVPYPLLDDKMKAIQNSYQKRYGDGWKYGVEVPTVRKVRQAIGRAVRSPTDKASRVLLDKRYTPSSSRNMGKYSFYTSLPKELREEIKEVRPEEVGSTINSFFSD